MKRDGSESVNFARNVGMFLFVFVAAGHMSCLNKGNNVESNSNSGSSENVTALSNKSIVVKWNAAPGASSYQVFSQANQNVPIAETVFTEINLNGQTPSAQQVLKIYKVTSGGRNPRPIQTNEFSNWPSFSSTTLTAATQQYAGIGVNWTYAPWANGGLAAAAGALEGSNVNCYFLKTALENGLAPRDDADSVVVSEPVAAGKLKGGLALEPLTQYKVQCEIAFVDGTVDVHSSIYQVISSDLLDEPSENVNIDIAPIQISRAISFLVSNIQPGDLLNVQIQALDQANQVVATPESFSRDNLGPNATLIQLSSPLPTSPNAYGGRYRITGTFDPAEQDGVDPPSRPIAIKSFYIKTADSPDAVLHPAIPNLVAAQSMGSALATGDFNCDGADDLAVGLSNVSWKDPNGGVHPTGVVIVYYGIVGSLSDNRTLYYDVAPIMPGQSPLEDGVGIRPIVLVPDADASSVYDLQQGQVQDPRAKTRFGAALAVGNFNRDYRAQDVNTAVSGGLKGRACADLVIGAPGEWTDGDEGGSNSNPVFTSAGGSMYVFYGSPTGLRNNSIITSQRAYTPNFGVCTPGSGTFPAYHPSNDPLNAQFGGKLDPDFEHPGNCATHRIYPFDLSPNSGNVCFDTGTGRVSCALTGAQPHQSTKPFYRMLEYYPFIYQGASSNISTYSIGSQFGSAISTGDWNRDGYDDIIVGAPFAHGTYATATASVTAVSISHSGAAFVYFGSTKGVYTKFKQDSSAAQDTVGAPAIEADYSPVKLHLPAGKRGSYQYAGTSVDLGNVLLGQLDPGGFRTERLSSTDFGQAFVGIPGIGLTTSDNRGAVAVLQSNGNDAPARFGYLTSAGSNPSMLWGQQAGDRFGTSLALGAFRDPRYGRLYPDETGNVPGLESIGLDEPRRQPFRQALAIGAPGRNGGSGTVYVWTFENLNLASTTPNSYSNLYTPNDGAAGTSLYTTRVGVQMCSAPTVAFGNGKQDCLGTVIDNPGGITDREFGKALGVIRAPVESYLCQAAGTCYGTPFVVGSTSGKWQPFFNREKIDSLLIGATKYIGGSSSSKLGTVWLLAGEQDTGLSLAAQLSNPLGTGSLNDDYGMSLTGGYYLFNTDESIGPNYYDFESIVGAPSQSKFGSGFSLAERQTTIPSGGSVFVFTLNSAGQFSNTSDVDLAQETPNPFGANDYLSISNVTRSGFSDSRPVGDLNCDGYSDVIVPHIQNVGGIDKTELLVLFGSATGLVTKKQDGTSAIPTDRSQRFNNDPFLGSRAPQWINTVSWTALNDPNPLANFSPVGSINGDNCDDLVVANRNVVVLHGSNSGLALSAAPSTGPSGSNPKWVRFPDITPLLDSSNWNTFTDESTLPGAPFSISNPPTTAVTAAINQPNGIDLGAAPSFGGTDAFPSLQPNLSSWKGYNTDLPGARAPICHGDFNGDGFGDIAIGTVHVFRTLRQYYAVDPNNPNPQDFYLDIDGSTPINAQMNVFYGSAQGLQTSFTSDAYNYTITSTQNPFDSQCTDNGSSADRCPPAILFDPDQIMPPTTTSYSADALAYLPWRMWRYSALHHASTATDWSAITDRFGELCVSAGDLNGDGFDDLVIPLPRSVNRKSSFIVFRGSNKGLGNNATPQVPDPNRIIKVQVSDSGVDFPGLDAGLQNNLDNATTQAELNNAALGSSGALLGSVDGRLNGIVAMPTIALGAPKLAGPNGADMGSVVLIFGDKDLLADSPLNPSTTSISGNVANRVIPYFVCDKTGLTCGQFLGTGANPQVLTYRNRTWGQMIRPDWADSQNTSMKFGEYVDSAGNVNGDNYFDLLVPLPNFTDPGRIRAGTALVYFGNNTTQGSLDGGWNDPISGVYSMKTPDPNASCNSTLNRCTPLMITPEFAEEEQRWMSSSAVTISYQSVQSRYKGTNVGSQNPGSQDGSLNTHDILMMPQDNFEHEVFSTITNLGGLTVWQ